MSNVSYSRAGLPVVELGFHDPRRESTGVPESVFYLDDDGHLMRFDVPLRGAIGVGQRVAFRVSVGRGERLAAALRAAGLLVDVEAQQLTNAGARTCARLDAICGVAEGTTAAGMDEVPHGLAGDKLTISVEGQR